ncbi:MAG: type IV toxin-antitoxin system AbiEi family antitoxin domain-containing protein [Patescibacteria group bacterium]|nr:type IV toxin-antitoxin system AbiEi family antitoxin domain-containing protein [Patescibacteria group bacterium]
MTKAQEKQLIKRGLFSTGDAEKAGLSRPAISRLVQQGTLLRVGRGLYMHENAKSSPTELGFQIACAKFGPQSAIGGLSALFHYNLIEQVPQQTWIIVPESKTTKELGYRLLRMKVNRTVGIVDKDRYRIVSLERALVEGLKLSSKIGERTALRAVREALSKRLTTEKKVGEMAKALGLLSAVTRYSEAIFA